MDEPRPIVELLRVMREWCAENFELQQCNGLCMAAACARMGNTITFLEMCDFEAYVDKTRPRRSGSAYGWNPRELQPRLDWLQEQIDILTNQNQD